jgi:hypothetical protein
VLGIEAADVRGRVGLGEAEGLRLRECLGIGAAGREPIEHVVAGAVQHAAQAGDPAH